MKPTVKNDFKPKASQDAEIRQLVIDSLLNLIETNAIQVTSNLEKASLSTTKHRNRRKKLSKNVRKALSESITNSTVHGFSNMFKTEYLANKLMWTAFFLIATAACSWFILTTVETYLNYEVVSTIKVIREDRLEFPTIFFCAEKKQTLSILGATFDGIDITAQASNISLLGQDCFIFRNESEAHFYQNDLGAGAGLDITFYLSNEGVNTIRIIIGEKRFLPKYKELNKNFVEQGKTVYISMTKTVSKSMPEPFNRCLEKLDSAESFNSEYYRLTIQNKFVYRQANCYDVCAFKDISNICKCTADIIYSNSNYTDDCLNDTGRVSRCRENFFKSFNSSLRCAASCPLECSSNLYRFDSRFLDYRSTGSERQSLRKVLQVSGDIKANMSDEMLKNYMDKKCIRLKIFFDELQYEMISETARLTEADLVSNIGGTMGLFLGLSVLSFVEILEFIVKVVCLVQKAFTF